MPPLEFDPAQYSYLDKETGKYWSQSRVRSVAEAERIFSKQKIDVLSERWELGQLTEDQWETEMRGLIKKATIRQYLLGRGGRSQMGSSEWGQIGNRLRDQYSFLEGFKRDLEFLTPGQVRARAQLYINSTRWAYERGGLRMRGINAKLIPLPGDGKTPCRANCKCYLEYRYYPNGWDITWKLGQADHCPGCIDRAATYNPLQIRDGEVIRLLAA